MTNKLGIRFKHFAMGALVAALGAGTYVIAAVTFSDFVPNSPISSSAMNTKLNALKDAVNRGSVCPANTPSRFTDNGDGTICDSETGLMWEKKNNVAGDVHNVNNTYAWSANSPDPDGTLYSDFLAQLNLAATDDATQTCFANHCDWRIPTIAELRSIAEFPDPGFNCPRVACIDEIFLPTRSNWHWTSSSGVKVPANAWMINFGNPGSFLSFTKAFGAGARAVRGGR